MKGRHQGAVLFCDTQGRITRVVHGDRRMFEAMSQLLGLRFHYADAPVKVASNTR